MINWGQIIGQAFPFIILLFIGAILSGLLKPSKKRKNNKKYNKKNKKEKNNNTKKEEENNNEENFNITFETNPDEELKKTIEKIKKNLEGKEDKYKPKKEKPPYWTEKIYNKDLTKNEKTNEKKGKEYEKYVGKFFEEKGYIIKYNGIENGKKDNSIDLIAIKNNEIIFIQCKNWKENNKFKITHKDIKAFIGDTYIFIKENPQYTNYNIKRLFVMSNKILDKSAYAYIKEHKNIINYKIIFTQQ